MVTEEICKLLQSKFSDAIEDAVLEGIHPYVLVTADRWPEIAMYLRDEPQLRFNLLRCISTLDLLADDKLACIYDLMRIPLDGGDKLVTETHEFSLRIVVDRNNPVIPSVAHVWPAADWHEREAYDMMGIQFTNHPDMRRILCPDDWVGYPLRKDYDFPLEYHGIPATTEFDLTNPRH